MEPMVFVYSFTIEGYDVTITIEFFPHIIVLEVRFSNSDRSLNRKKERFKVFEVEPRLNRGRTVMTS